MNSLPTPAAGTPAGRPNPLRARIQQHLSLLLLLTLLPGTVAGAPLTREAAVTALFAPGSGVSIDTTTSSVWLPTDDLGGGRSFRGLFRAGTRMDPHLIGGQPRPGPGLALPFDAYCFFVDDEPESKFLHPTRFVLVAAEKDDPTVAGGGIIVSEQGWWPVFTLPDGTRFARFDTVETRSTPAAPGAGNPAGLIAGPGLIITAPGGEAGAGLPRLRWGKATAANPCGLIILGHSDFATDVGLYESDLTNVHGVKPGRIVKANGGAAASSTDVKDAIQKICDATPACDKIYVRISSHGSVGEICLTDGSMSASNLCNLLKQLAAKGVPICLLVDACFSGSLIDPHRWNFPAGSVIITAASSNETSYGHRTIHYTNEVGTRVSNSLFSHAFSVCLRSTNADVNRDSRVDDAEAARWVTSNRPCYTWLGNNQMRYPGGIPPGIASTNYRTPQIVEVGRDPQSLNLNVCNGTGQPKNDFHMVFKGNVAGGLARAWRSDANDRISGPWGRGEPTIVYDPATDETTVTWEDPGQPVQPNQYIHFGYQRPAGGLRPIRQNWTPRTPATPVRDEVPATHHSIRPVAGSGHVIVRLISSGASEGGIGAPMFGFLGYRISPTPIPLENLSRGDPMIQELPLQPIGTLNLQPDRALEFTIPVPDFPPDWQPTLILEQQAQWPLNPNLAHGLVQFLLPTATTPPVPPVLRLERPFPGLLVLSWDEPAAILERSFGVDDRWQDVPGAVSPWTLEIIPDLPRHFFRLRLP